MAKEAEPYDSDSSVVSYTPMVVCESPNGTYRVGYIITPDGVVGLYDQPDRPRSEAMTKMSVAHDGRDFERSWRRTFSDPRLKTLAKRFAAEVAGRAALSEEREA